MKRILLVVGVIFGMMALWAGPAAAQDQTMTVDPPSVSEAGEHEVTVSGEGFTVDVFLLPCPGAEGSLEAMASGDAQSLCNLGALTPVSPDGDGNWSATVTYDIPAEGLVLAAGDAAGTNSAAAVILVGEAMEEEAMEEEAMEEEAMEEEAMEEEAMEEEAMEEEAMADDLPATGVGSALATIIAASVVIAGALFLNTARKASQL